MNQKPKMKLATMNTEAASRIASEGSAAVALQPEAPEAPASVAAPPATLGAVVPSQPAPKANRPSKKDKAAASDLDRLYLYVPTEMARAIRIHCAGEHVSQSDFAREAFARELKRLGAS